MGRKRRRRAKAENCSSTPSPRDTTQRLNKRSRPSVSDAHDSTTLPSAVAEYHPPWLGGLLGAAVGVTASATPKTSRGPLHYGDLHPVRNKPAKHLLSALASRAQGTTQNPRNARECSVRRLENVCAYDTHGPGQVLLQQHMDLKRGMPINEVAIVHPMDEFHDEGHAGGVGTWHRVDPPEWVEGCPLDRELESMRERARVVEIAARDEFLFSLDQFGLCAVFNLNEKRRIGYMNASIDEVVRSIFLNTAIDSIITVSMSRAQNYCVLEVRSTTLSELREGNLKKGRVIFETEELKYPAFIDFDEDNGRILTFSPNDGGQFCVWDIVTYQALFRRKLTHPKSQLKFIKGFLCEIHHTPENSLAKFRFIDVTTGEDSGSVLRPVRRGKRTLFLGCLARSVLLLKQEGENIRVVDISCIEHPVELPEIPKTYYVDAASVMTFPDQHCFLIVQSGVASIHDWTGKKQRTLENYEPWGDQHVTRTSFARTEQDLIISFGRDLEHPTPPGSSYPLYGAINIAHVPSGKKIAALSVPPLGEANGMTNDRSLTLAHTALRQVTCLFYNEKKNQLFTGSSRGMVHMWR